MYKHRCATIYGRTLLALERQGAGAPVIEVRTTGELHRGVTGEAPLDVPEHKRTP